ncbi:hypothetical protein HYE34_03440 [Mycoplasmopsis bovis]|nr:hypothetical protein HYE34_03440 [Mycoplasmopsis bovis]
MKNFLNKYENKKCKTHYDQWKRLVNKYKRYNLGMNIESMSKSPKNKLYQTKSNDEILDEF